MPKPWLFGPDSLCANIGLCRAAFLFSQSDVLLRARTLPNSGKSEYLFTNLNPLRFHLAPEHPRIQPRIRENSVH